MQAAFYSTSILKATRPVRRAPVRCVEWELRPRLSRDYCEDDFAVAQLLEHSVATVGLPQKHAHAIHIWWRMPTNGESVDRNSNLRYSGANVHVHMMAVDRQR